MILCLLLAGCGNQSAANPSGHTDINDDGLCDSCGESMLVSFDIYAINDLHGKLADTDFQPGVDELTTYLQKARQEGNTIVLSTGDMWQGTSESNLTNGFIITEWMNKAGFTAMTIGGHEFDWGEDVLRQNRQLAQFPFLAINIYNRETDQPADYCESSLVVEMDGVQIGIIGAIGNVYSSISSQQTKDIYFKTGDALTALVKAESERLREQGVDFIIYAIHDGYNETSADGKPIQVSDEQLAGYYDATLSQGYVDLVFEADTHYWYSLVDRHGVYHLQAGGNNKGLSYAKVLINKANGNGQLLNAQLIASSDYVHMEDDPAVEALLEKYAQQIAPATEILGNNGQYRNNYAVCQLVANLYCDKGVEKWGDAYDIVLGGGYISCRSPGYMPEGSVSYSQLQSLLPFDNQITLCSIQGRDLLSKFLETDHHAYYIKTTPYGESIRGSIDPEATYYVVTDSYSAYYSYNNMTVVDIYDQNIFARDLMADYIAQGNLE